MLSYKRINNFINSFFLYINTMSYKNNKYTYSSKQQYLHVLATVFSTFLVGTYFIALMKPIIHDVVYYFSIIVGIVMMIHLALKYEYAVGGIKHYKFDKF